MERQGNFGRIIPTEISGPPPDVIPNIPGFQSEEIHSATSFPGSLILPLAPGGKMRDPGNEVVHVVQKLQTKMQKY